MKNKIDLDNITFHLYNPQNESHQEFIKEFSQDELTNKYFVFSQGILPKYRGNNYASLIRNNVIEYLKSIGVENMVAYVRLDNENIIRNFFKNGFKIERVGSTDLYQVTYLERENKNVR